MSTVLDELVYILGFQMDPKTIPTIQKFESVVEEVTKKIGWMATGLVAAASSALLFAKNSNETTADLQRFSMITGQNSDSMQKWGYTALAAGANIAGVQSDIRNLLSTMNSPIPGKFNQGMMMLMGTGYDTSKNIDQVLMDIQDKFSRMTPRKQMQWAAEIGLSDDTLMMLKMSKEELIHFRKEAENIPVILTPEQLHNAMEFRIQYSMLTARLDYFGKVAATVAGPALSKMVATLDVFIKEHKGFIQSFLQQFIDGSIDGFDRLGGKLGWLLKMISGFSGPDKPLEITDFISDGVQVGVLAVILALGTMYWQWIAIAGAIVYASKKWEEFNKYAEDRKKNGQQGSTAMGFLLNKADPKYQEPNVTEKAPIFQPIFDLFKSLKEDWNNRPKDFKGYLPEWMQKGMDNDSSSTFRSMDETLKKMALDISLMAMPQKIAMMDSVPAYLRNVAQGNVNHNHFEIPIHVHGGDSKDVAQKTGTAVYNAISSLFPGGLKPVVG